MSKKARKPTEASKQLFMSGKIKSEVETVRRNVRRGKSCQRCGLKTQLYESVIGRRKMFVCSPCGMARDRNLEIVAARLHDIEQRAIKRFKEQREASTITRSLVNIPKRHRRKANV